LRGLLAENSPAFEAAVAELTSSFVLALLQRFGGPWGMRTAGKAKVRVWASRQKRVPQKLLDALIDASWVMEHKPAGADTRESGPIPAIAAHIQQLTDQRKMIEKQINTNLEKNITYQMLLTMPGVGVQTAANLVSLVDITMFKSVDHLASYAGIAPQTHESGTSIKGERASRAGNRALKNTLFMSAFASLQQDPKSRAYYDAKRAAGKKHNTAVISLARRRLKVMFAIMKTNTPYHD
jgi:transposase